MFAEFGQLVSTAPKWLEKLLKAYFTFVFKHCGHPVGDINILENTEYIEVLSQRNQNHQKNIGS